MGQRPSRGQLDGGTQKIDPPPSHTDEEEQSLLALMGSLSIQLLREGRGQR
ncbi:hypothetical protein ABG768_021135, partial [Culter alburnus]